MKKNTLILLSLLGLLFSSNLLAVDSSNVQQLKKENFAKFVYQDITIVDFYANWCGPCKRFAPIFDEASLEMDGIISFGKVNADEEFSLSNQYDIMYLPTIIIFKNGVEFQRKVGVLDTDDLKEFIQSVLY